MTNIFVCEDHDEHRTRLKELIDRYVFIEELSMEVVLTTPDPYELLKYVVEQKVVDGLYFLDIELQCDMTGIELATKIRKYDKRGMIVFVTADKNSLGIIMKYHVEATDYILKCNDEEMVQQIQKCINLAQERLVENEVKKFVFKMGDKVMGIPYHEILYFEKLTGNKKNNVQMITKFDEFEFRGTLKEIEQRHEAFYSIGGYVINFDNVDFYDIKTKEIIVMKEFRFLVPKKKSKKVIEIVENRGGVIFSD